MNRWNRIVPAAFLMYHDRVHRQNQFLHRDSFFAARFPPERESDRAGFGHILCRLLPLADARRLPGSGVERKTIYLRALLFWGVAATMCGFPRSIHCLLVWRFLLGTGEGGVWPATIVLLANWFAPGERARANGY